MAKSFENELCDVLLMHIQRIIES